MPASSRLRAVLALLLFLPVVLCCFLFASHLAGVWIGAETPDRARLSLLAGHLLGLGLPCLAAAELFRLGRPELGIASVPWRSLVPAVLFVLGLWPGLLALDSLRARWFQDAARQEDFRLLATPGAGGLAAVFGILAVLPALMEETVFRGILQPLLEKAWGRGPAVVLTAALFSAYHLNAEQVLVPLLLGLALGWLRSSTGSLLPCMLCHALHNGVAVLAMTYVPQWGSSWPCAAAGLLLALVSARALGRPALKAPPGRG